tara:strand:- start:1733 stop:3808 length:2076 start_codon:yes stop_codon:yes gene_type:complete
VDRFRSYAPLDDTPLNDGDSYWLGFFSRFQPTYLKAGQAYFSGNFRMEKGTCRVRKGLKGLSNDISVTNPPLIVGAFSLVLSKAITSITRAVNEATVTTTAAHGYTTADRVNIRGATQTDYNGDYTITVTGATTFTYTVANTPVTPATGTMFANKGPRVFNNYASQVVGSGNYADDSSNTEGIIIASTNTSYLYRYGTSSITISYPANETVTLGAPCDIVQFLNNVYMFRGYSISAVAPAAVTSITRAATTATLTTTAPHGLASNSWVTVVGASPDGYNGMVQITVTGASTFTYTVSGALATPATGTITIRPCKPPLYWDMNTSTAAWQVVPTGPNAGGAPLIKMPAVDWGVFFKSRFVLPWSRDQIVLSDFLDANSYDPSLTQFRILPGTADWIVGAFPYQQARLLVLYRKSVHTVWLDGSSLSVAAAYEITRNFGCVARKSVANCGPFIVWLSDIGVVRMEIGNELSLTNTAAPLSDPIQDQIDTINWAYAGNSVGTYWNNRYYLAAPTGTSTVNNTIFVYNFLNEAWESVDTYPSGYDVVNFHVISYNGTKRIHTVGTVGYVSLLEENDFDEFGAPQALAEYPILGSLKTRNYLAGTYDMKRVRRFQTDINVSEDDAFTAQYVLSNPDHTMEVLDYTASATTDATLRTTVNRRGISARIEFATTNGRPEFKSVTAESTATSRATLNYT